MWYTAQNWIVYQKHCWFAHGSVVQQLGLVWPGLSWYSSTLVAQLWSQMAPHTFLQCVWDTGGAAAFSSMCLGQTSWQSEHRASPQANENSHGIPSSTSYCQSKSKGQPRIKSWEKRFQLLRIGAAKSQRCACPAPVNERRGVITTTHLCKPFNCIPEARMDRRLGSTMAEERNHDWKTCKMCWESHTFRILWRDGECKDQGEWRWVLHFDEFAIHQRSHKGERKGRKKGEGGSGRMEER